MASQRTRRQVSHPEWSEVRRHLHLRINEAAVVLNATPNYLRHLCRDNGLSRWPRKKIRSLNAMAAMRRNHQWRRPGTESSAQAAGLGGPGGEVVETDNRVDDDKIADDPPAELTTLNLIDKVGLQSTSE